MARHHFEQNIRDEVIVLGKVSTSQDGTIVSGGAAPCQTAGHGNCPKVAVIIEN